MQFASTTCSTKKERVIPQKQKKNPLAILENRRIPRMQFATTCSTKNIAITTTNADFLLDSNPLHQQTPHRASSAESFGTTCSTAKTLKKHQFGEHVWLHSN